MGKKWKAGSEQESFYSFCCQCSTPALAMITDNHQPLQSSICRWYRGHFYFQPTLYRDMQDPVDMCCKILLYQSNRIIPICNTYGLGKGQRYFITILHCLLEVYIVFSQTISLLLAWLQDCVLFKKVHAQLWKNQRWSEMEMNWGLLQTPYQTNC